MAIPKEIAKNLYIENNTTLELSIKNGAIIIKPQNETLLESLVAGIDANNLHREVKVG